MRRRSLALACLALPLLLSSCSVDEAPQGLKRTPLGAGPSVRWDIQHRPLPDIPMPNDVATWPDPTSRTGLRVNASTIAPTSIEHAAREKFGTLEGWATYGWLSVGFDKHTDGSRADAAIDLANVRHRHQGDDYDLANDAVYIVNLRTGVPVPIDLGGGSFNYVLREKTRYAALDPRRSEQYLLFETYDETAGGPLDREYEPSLDTDFDGRLDIPNLDNPRACPPPPANPDDPAQLERDRCLADHLVDWYERETDTLLISPMIPLEESTEYAVVLTDRLIDTSGNPVLSPFEFVYHPMQERGIGELQNQLRNSSVSQYYGDIGGTGLDHVAFAWVFTTQPVVDDMKRLRDGLYGKGSFAHLAQSFPPKLEAARAVGQYPAAELADGNDETGWQNTAKCKPLSSNLVIVRPSQVRYVFEQVAGGLGIKGKEAEAFMTALDAIDYMMIGTYKSPYFMEGGPSNTDPNATFRLNYLEGTGEIHEDTVPFILMVPRATGTSKPPFPVSLHGHGTAMYKLEAFAFGGNLARQGIATLAIDAPGHGFQVGDDTRTLIRMLLKGSCLGPLYDSFLSGRARDLNGDGKADNGADLWTAYIFHTRDDLRQTVLDSANAVRIFRTFDGVSRTQDYNGDGKLDLAGDFDVDGTVDVGGPNVSYSISGASFGGLVAGVLGGLDPYVETSSPNSGGGGLIQIAVRSFQSQVVDAITMRVIGPLLVGTTTPDSPDTSRTSCAAGELAVQWLATNLSDIDSVEIACVPASTMKNATVIARNAGNGETRCARTDSAGQFRTGMPSSVGDRVTIEIYDGADAVQSYGSCALKDGATLRRVISTWESSRVENGAKDSEDRVLCSAPTGCARFQQTSYPVGGPLVAPADGNGYGRQSPTLRQFVQLSQSSVNSADPVNFAPYYALRPMTDENGAVVPPHGVVTVHTIGDMNVPINAGFGYARASGALPFLRPEAASAYPALADYATPPSLYTQLGGRTPNQLLIDSDAIEGIARLARHPAGTSCTENEVTNDNASCHPACPPADPEGSCLSGQSCVEGLCQKVIGSSRCAEALFDLDDLSEGMDRFDAQRAPVPLRLARVARHADASNLDAIWAPRLAGVPFAKTDQGAWDASEPVVGMILGYLRPEGTHTYNFMNPCDAFDASMYLQNMTARLFATRGRDLYPLSHPATHRCLHDVTCKF